MFIGKEDYEKRQKQWESFNIWEEAFEKNKMEYDLDNSFIWYAEAWNIAKDKNPNWLGHEIDQEKIFRLQKIRNVFTRLGEI